MNRPAISGQIIANRNSRVYHQPDCPAYHDVSERNQIYFKTAAEAVESGLSRGRKLSAMMSPISSDDFWQRLLLHYKPAWSRKGNRRFRHHQPNERSLLDLGLTYRQVQMMTGHKDIRTVVKYDYERGNTEENAINFLRYDRKTVR